MVHKAFLKLKIQYHRN